jgi:hypothetical protein
MNTRELLQLALSALEDCDKSDRAWFSDVVLLNKIRAHLEKTEPEPVAWVHAEKDEPYDGLQWFKDSYSNTPLFTKEQL